MAVGTQAPTSALNILVVEDEMLIALELCELLENGGYHVMGPVATVAAALQLLLRELPHACVLDVNLRGEHSAPVAQALKKQNVPFVLSSAYTRETLNQYPAFEGIANIGKPAPSDKLLSTLGLLLNI